MPGSLLNIKNTAPTTSEESAVEASCSQRRSCEHDENENVDYCHGASLSLFASFLQSAPAGTRERVLRSTGGGNEEFPHLQAFQVIALHRNGDDVAGRVRHQAAHAR